MSDQEQKPLTLSPELAELMERMVSAAVKASRAPNAKETREIEADIERERRRTMLAVELGKVEQEHQERRKNGCSHSRYENGSKNAGQPAPKGTGEWTTGGQLVGRDTACTICVRCAYNWIWKPTWEEREYINNVGMLGMAPPKPEQVISEG
jgi:hypothetical protein